MLSSRKPRNAKYRVREYYDGGIVRLDQVRVPSKRVGYKIENGIHVAKIPVGVPEFEDGIRQAFHGTMAAWPLVGRLLVGIGLNLPKKEYQSTDVDNMAKAILDAFKSVAYADDSQIDCLFVSKSISDKWSTWIAFKTLGDDPKSWFLEPMLEGLPKLR
jgi:Holliday junction resolvase RusA-like endonuclease